jgi:hypothetical protein
MSDEFPWGLPTLRRMAALHGCVVRHMPEDQGDRLQPAPSLSTKAEAGHRTLTPGCRR